MSGRESTPRPDEAHDVLAAEEFAVPAADPSLRHRPITLPEDPSGIAEAHDVLAAEEFAMPAPRQPSGPTSTAGRLVAKAGSPGRFAVVAVVALAVWRKLLRRPRP